MKKLTALLLALTLLLTLAAPALAKDIRAEGNFGLELNLEVPENNRLFDGFTVRIPDGCDIEYGTTDTKLYYNIDVDPEVFPYGLGVNLDVTSPYFNEWDYEDENGNKQVDTGFVLVNDNDSCAIDNILFIEDGRELFRIDPAPYGWEEKTDKMLDGYNRNIGGAANGPDRNSYLEGTLHVETLYDRSNPPTPGNYRSELVFNVNINWTYNRNEMPDGFEYVIVDGFEDNCGDDDTSAFDSAGWPYFERVEGIRAVDENNN